MKLLELFAMRSLILVTDMHFTLSFLIKFFIHFIPKFGDFFYIFSKF